MGFNIQKSQMPGLRPKTMTVIYMLQYVAK